MSKPDFQRITTMQEKNNINTVLCKTVRKNAIEKTKKERNVKYSPEIEANTLELEKQKLILQKIVTKQE